MDRRAGVRGHPGGIVLHGRTSEQVMQHDEGPDRDDREERHDEE
jgi:hypothetical protein